MATNEKEYNGFLFDQLSIVERLIEAHEEGNFEKVSKKILEEINRKLYQTPPLANE